MLELTSIEQTALDYLLSNLEVHLEHYYLFEVVGQTCFDNNEWMINISIVGLVGEYWTVFVNGTTGNPLPDWEFNSDCQDCSKPHQYSHLPDYLKKLLDRLTVKLLR